MSRLPETALPLSVCEPLDGGAAISLHWADGVVARFHAEWLRDNALDASTRSPGNGQRLISIADIPADSIIVAAELVNAGHAIALRFEPGRHETHFTAAWLRAHRYDLDHARTPGWVGETVERWDRATRQDCIPRSTFEAVSTDRGTLADWLDAIDRVGFAVLHGVPPESGRLCDVVGLFGFVRETNYGRWFDVRTQLDPSNLAYTNLGLQGHTDNPYRDPVPTVQLLHCLENSVDGGSSSVVDGFACAERLRVEDPHGFALLSGHPARFEYAGSADVWLRAKRPLIELGPDGELLAVRFNNRSAAPSVDIPFDEMRAYLSAYRRFASYVDDPAMQVTFTLAPGDLFVVDNARILHAREAFSGSGTRWLQGCYSDMDGVRSTLAVLRREQAVDALVAEIVDVFERRGAEEYLGEDVTMAEHMLQAAALAAAEGADAELVVAALLHDVGHFTGELGTYSPKATVDHRHEVSGVRMLQDRLPQRVTDCVRLHVAAKRYLCAVEPAYLARLSAASLHTLQLQGGPMGADEIAAFEAEPHHLDAVRVRRWDEAAKTAGLEVPPLERHLPELRLLARRAYLRPGAAAR